MSTRIAGLSALLLGILVLGPAIEALPTDITMHLSLEAIATGLQNIDLHSIASKLRSLTLQDVINAARTFWDFVGPGGKLHPGWFLEHKGHLVIEGLLMFTILYLFLQSKNNPKEQEEEALTEKVRPDSQWHHWFRRLLSAWTLPGTVVCSSTTTAGL